MAKDNRTNQPNHPRNHGGGGGGTGKGVTDGPLYTGDTGEYGAQTDPQAYFNFLLGQQGITPETVPSDVWNYTQNQMYNNWYTGYTNALGQNKTLTLAQYSGQEAAPTPGEAPNKRKNPNQYKRWQQNGGNTPTDTTGVGAGLVNPVNVGEISKGLFQDQAEQNPQDFYLTQLQRSGQLSGDGAQGYDTFIKQDQFNNRYSQYQLDRQQAATAAPAGPAPGSFGAPQNNGVVTTPGGIEDPQRPNRHQHPNQYQHWQQRQNARNNATGDAGTTPAAPAAPGIGAPGTPPSGLYTSWYANQQSLDPQQRLQQDNAAFNVLTPAQKAYKFGVQSPFDRSRIVNWA